MNYINKYLKELKYIIMKVKNKFLKYKINLNSNKSKDFSVI